MAGKCAAHLFDLFLQGKMIAHLRQLVGKIPHQPLEVDLAQHGRRLAHHHGAHAERLQHQTHLGQFGLPGGEPPRTVLAQFHHFGQQQRLTFHAVGLELVLQAFVHQPLMRSVLIDDHHALIGLGHDVGLMQLGPRNTQWIVAVGDPAPGGIGRHLDAR
jgi:hypothetical protein